MHKTILLLAFAFVLSAAATENAIERWATALGGRDKVAGVKAIYREGTLQFAGREGTIKVWHTADGKYRKEEKVGEFSSVEAFDGAKGFVQQGNAPPREFAGDELALAKSKAFANSNAIFFVFFPERHRGSRSASGDIITFRPEGGVEWHVTLDAQTSLPASMVHDEAGKTITVRFDSYERIDGIPLEKEIRRSAGNPNMGAVIRFSKTVLNPTIEPSLFAAPAGSASINQSANPIEIVRLIQRADYEGDRATLAKCYNALSPVVDSDHTASRIRYWRGFALWRSAINGFNDAADPAELEQLFVRAVDEFKESLAKDGNFADAKIGMISCLGYVAFIHRQEAPRVQELLAQISPLVKEVKASVPDNPRFIWVLGPILWHTPAERGGGLEKVMENYEHGLAVCARLKPSDDPLEPSWGKPELLMSRAYACLNKTPPDVAAAERDARAALELVPYWHYARDILLPQIVQAKVAKK